MPYGSLTPLGRQLRSVLVNLRPNQAVSSVRCRQCRPQHAQRQAAPSLVDSNGCAKPLESRQAYHASTTTHTAAAVAAVSQPDEDGPMNHPVQPAIRRYDPTISRRRLSRRKRVDRISEALLSTGQSDVTPSRLKNRLDLSHLNAQSWGRLEHRVNERRHKKDRIPSLAHTREIRLSTILAKCIQHKADVAQVFEAERMRPFSLEDEEAALLERHGYDISDVQVWANIISTPDSLDAATALADRIAARGPRAVPLFVLLYLLRRDYLSARALRLLTQQAWLMLSYWGSRDEGRHLPTNAAFMLFSRFVRHAREVWPKALESLPELLLQYSPRQASDHPALAAKQIASLTYALNKAMRLLAVPTAVEPFKSNDFQEAGIVRMLRFMAGQDPPLQINREGYRAVISVQLAQRKTSKDQQWAELKALSWPPWKEERTAMDSDITPDDHGVSKAGQTLQRMREAGYGFRDWEKVASIYTGWDTDGTPTTQTLVQLGGGVKRFDNRSAEWVARIVTTRTMQEAWACYLAYEDQKLPPNQEVYLAIFAKLRQEEKRRWLGENKRHVSLDDHRWGLFPGDGKEVEPLPPSTHLYTYTRTNPPSFDDFYSRLRERGVIFNGHCLAFLVANAKSLKLGMQYLQEGIVRHKELKTLLTFDSSEELTRIPMPLFNALIHLLSRFSKVPLSSTLSIQSIHSNQVNWSTHALSLYDSEELNANHALVHALELIKRRRPKFLPPWNFVLRGLGNESSLENIGAIYVRYTNKKADYDDANQSKWSGAITAYRLVRKVLSIMRDVHIDLDSVGFMALCQATENVVIGCWMIMRQQHQHSQGRAQTLNDEGREAINLIRSSHHVDRLKGEFRILVGDDTSAATHHPPDFSPSEPKLSLLEVPSPALLHAYLRALGWMADYKGLLETVRWMVANKSELSERCERDRNGQTVMRRAIVALRVFLERSWLDTPEADEGELSDSQSTSPENPSRLVKHLRRLQAAASEEVIDEVNSLIDSVDQWGGWPEDEEVDKYCQSGRFVQFQ